MKTEKETSDPIGPHMNLEPAGENKTDQPQACHENGTPAAEFDCRKNCMHCGTHCIYLGNHQPTKI